MHHAHGHMDLKAPAGILAILLVVALWERIPAAWFWATAAMVAVVFVVFVALEARRTEPRVEEADGRTVIRFDGTAFEWDGAPLETSRWTSGGAFGQPLESWMALKRAGEVLYQGREKDAERLLAFLESRKKP